MKNIKRNSLGQLYNVLFIGALCLIFFGVSGCTPLRKKFTRQKKKEDKNVGNKFIPVLDPVDYPERIYSQEEKYRHTYSIWKVWNKDLLYSLQDDASDKRQKYNLGQVMAQLEKMNQYLEDQKQNELDILITEFRTIQDIYNRPSAMRNKFSIRKKIELNAKKIRQGFTPDIVFPDEIE